MRFGTSYYPELVDPAAWERDLDLMRGSGLDHLRLLDFAWSAIEPREGSHDWGWLDRFVDAAARRGFGLILATPTATPPAWFARQYPEAMLHGRDRRPRKWGNRREGDIEHPIYRDFCTRIAEALGRRYGRHPAVLGWQLDNELIGSELLPPENHSPMAQWRFRAFLRRQHGEIETLNQRWGMRFWNQELDHWGEVETPHHDRPCLGHWLDYCRHFSESQRDFLALQATTLRPHLAAGQWISHNSTAVFGRGLDHRVYAEALDMVGWDAYAGAGGGASQAERPAFDALAHDFFRSTFHRPFWVFETGPMDRPHTPALMAEMAVRGAGGICFWHWRQHRAHVEMGCPAVCDHAGRPIPERLAALRALVGDPLLAPLPGPVSRAPAALLFSADGVRHGMQPEPYRQGRSDWYLRAVGAWAMAARALGVPLDVVRPGDQLDGYRLVIAPSPLLLTAEQGARLVDAARAGAVVAGSARSGHLDPWGAYHAELGRPLAELLGTVWNRQESAPEEAQACWAGRTLPVDPWAERVSAIDGEVLARVQGGAWDGAVAAYRRACGAGSAVYLPCWSPALCQEALALAAGMAGIATVVPAAGVGHVPDPLGRGCWTFEDASGVYRLMGSSHAAEGDD